MQPQQSSRIDLVEFKAHILKKLGADRTKRYFYFLDRFLSQQLSKNEFDKLCVRVLGRENLQLHNQFILSILKNACQASSPPPIHGLGHPRSVTQAPNSSCAGGDGHEQGGAILTNQSQNVPIWSNGVLPMSPRKGRSTRDRKLKDRPSPLGLNGKIESHKSVGTEESPHRAIMENGDTSLLDHQRSVQRLQAVAEVPENDLEGPLQRSADKSRLSERIQSDAAVLEDGEEVEQSSQLSFFRSHLCAPLGIPLCSASVGGARKAMPMAGSDFISCYDSGGFYDTETLRRHMEQIAAAQGLGGVSLECANILNNMLDAYLKRLIRSCMELVQARSPTVTKKPPANRQQIEKVLNGTWTTNHLHVQSTSGTREVMQDQRPQCSISLHDFKVAMELNPKQLGEDWPLLLEKICMHTFKE